MTTNNANTKTDSGGSDGKSGRAGPSQDQLSQREMVFVPFEGFAGPVGRKEQLRQALAESVRTRLDELSTDTLLMDSLLGTSTVNPAIQRHAEIMSDPRFTHPANVQRSSRIVNRLHENYGNGHVQRVVNIAQSSRPSAGIIQRDLSQEQVVTLAAEVHGVLGARRRDYGRLDAILTGNNAQDILLIYRRYEATYGGGSFARDLTSFVGGIPAREGQTEEEAQQERDSYWDRYAARLYDAGVGEIQRAFHAPRPIPVNEANERRWVQHWQRHFAGAGSERSYALLTGWILVRWDRIHSVEEIERRGWMPARNIDDFTASFGVLSEHPQVRQEGERAGQSFWGSIHGLFIADLGQTVEMARSYHQSYVAAHWAAQLAWNPLADPPPMRPELEQAIRDWHSINSRGRLPYADIAGWVSNWMPILTAWQANQFIPNWRFQRAGMTGAISAGP